MANIDIVVQQLRVALRAARLPMPCVAWTRAFLTSQRIAPASGVLSSAQMSSLVDAARTRVLASDLTSANFLDATHCMALPSPPPTVFAPDIAAATLPADVVVQVLDIEDLARSRWDQIEELEAVERGEMTKGRQVIRTAPVDSDNTTASSTVAAAETADGRQRNSQHTAYRLVVQDCKGFQAFAMELLRVEALGVGRTKIGAKLLISAGTQISRGTILLEPANCAVLGGGVASWHSKWLEEKKKRLQDLVSPAQTQGLRR